MIQWGSSVRTIDLGPVGTQHCPICKEDRPFHLILQYKIWGLWWIFNRITYKKYMYVCSVCGHGWELESKKVEETIGDSHIPFMHKYGLWILIAFFVISFIASTITYGTPTP